MLKKKQGSCKIIKLSKVSFMESHNDDGEIGQGVK